MISSALHTADGKVRNCRFALQQVRSTGTTDPSGPSTARSPWQVWRVVQKVIDRREAWSQRIVRSQAQHEAYCTACASGLATARQGECGHAACRSGVHAIARATRVDDPRLLGFASDLVEGEGRPVPEASAPEAQGAHGSIRATPHTGFFWGRSLAKALPSQFVSRPAEAAGPHRASLRKS